MRNEVSMYNECTMNKKEFFSIFISLLRIPLVGVCVVASFRTGCNTKWLSKDDTYIFRWGELGKASRHVELVL